MDAGQPCCLICTVFKRVVAEIDRWIQKPMLFLMCLQTALNIFKKRSPESGFRFLMFNRKPGSGDLACPKDKLLV